MHKPLFFVPLGNKAWFNNLGIENVIEADWNEEFEIQKNDTTSYKIGCTPCQHFSGRSLTDRNATLWSSWTLKTKARKFFFGGYLITINFLLLAIQGIEMSQRVLLILTRYQDALLSRLVCLLFQ